MKTFDQFLPASMRPWRWYRAFALLFVLAAVSLPAFLEIGQAVAQSDELAVSISADAESLQPGEAVTLTADISNAPPNKVPEYDWDICTSGICIPSSAHPLRFGWDKPITWTFLLTVSYDSGESVSSNRVSVVWVDAVEEPTPTPTSTPEPDTPTPTSTPEPATPTPTPAMEPATPTATPTSEPDTATPTSTPEPPTPTPTSTPVPDTPTPTSTPTPEPATPTPTSEPSTPSVSTVAVSSDAGDDDTYILGDVIQVTLTFSESVDVDTTGGTPTVSIDMDPADWGQKQASYASGSGTTVLTFTHTVVEPNLSTQGIAVLANTLALNGGAIRSASSQTDADLSHSGLNHDGSHKVDWRQTPVTPTPTSTPEPDTPTPTPTPVPVTPTLTSVPATPTPEPATSTPEPSTPTVSTVAVSSDAGGDDTYFLGDVIQITLTFSESVDVDTTGGTPTVSIDMDPADWGKKEAAYKSGSGTTALTFTYEVVEPNLSTQGIAVLANTLALNGGAIRSSSSQAGADLSHSGLSHDSSHKVDWRQSSSNTAPVVNTEVKHYALFTDTGNAPPETLVSKGFYKVFSDPDGDELTYSVSVAQKHRPLVDELTITLVEDVQVKDLEEGIFPRVFFKADADDDWKGISPALADPLLVTVTLTATDPGGLSASLDGYFQIDWESSPEPGAVANLEVIAEPGSLGMLATWDAVDGATSYKLRWRESGGEFKAADAVTVSDAVWGITVSDYGKWEVGVQGCNDTGCGPEASSAVDVVKAASLSLERPVDADGNVRSKTITANWDAVPDAASYKLSWQRLGTDAPAAQPEAVAQQSLAVSNSHALNRLSSGNSGQGPNTQPENQRTLTADETGAELTVPDDGAYQVELRALGDDGEPIAMAHGHLNQADGQPDTTAPWVEYAEIDGTTITIWFSEPLDETATGGNFSTWINIWGGTWTSGDSNNIEISGNKVTVRGNPRVKAVSTPARYTAGVQYYPPTTAGIRGLRDLAGNQVQRLTRYYYYIYILNVTGPPYVTNVAISSEPGDDGSYTSGDAITVRVGFSEAVDVIGTPRVKIDFYPADGGERWAIHARGSGTRLLEFDYTVVEGDLSTDGVAVLENTLEFNGGAIRGAPPGPSDNSRLGHKGLRHSATHKVVTTGSAAPILQSASVNGTTLTLTFSEALGAAASLANSAFTVQKTPQGGAEETVSLSGSPAISGATVTLTLASAALDTDAWVKVSYAKPTAGANNKIVDAGGVEAVSFTDEWVINDLYTTQPRLVRGEIDGDVMTIYFSEPLDEASLSVGQGDFFWVNLHYRSRRAQEGQCPGGNRSFTTRPREVYIKGNTVVVAGLDNREKSRASVDWTLVNFQYYADTTVARRLRDLAGNPVYTPRWTYRFGHNSSTNYIILDNITLRPWPKSTTVVGKQLTLTFSAPMDGGYVPAASAFTVKVNGSQVSLAGSNPVSVSGRTVTLTLASAVTASDTVTVSYAKPDSGPLRNVVCEYAPSFTDEIVTNSTP